MAAVVKADDIKLYFKSIFTTMLIGDHFQSALKRRRGGFAVGPHANVRANNEIPQTIWFQYRFSEAAAGFWLASAA